MAEGRVVGIDLGTTNSLVAYMEGDKPVVIPGVDGLNLVPSVVALDPIARTEYLLKLEGIELEEQSKAATEAARATGKAKQQIVPPDLLEEAFELNMQLEEMRSARKMGEDDPALQSTLFDAKKKFDGLVEDVDRDLRAEWKAWDAGDASKRPAAQAKMVALLDRRRYLSNLVRDVTETLSA